MIGVGGMVPLRWRMGVLLMVRAFVPRGWGKGGMVCAVFCR